MVVANSPGQTGNVTDTSDDGDDTDGNTVDDPTVVSVSTGSSIEVTKTATVIQNDGNLTNNTGDLTNYTIVIRNTGSVDISNISIVDTLTDGSGNILSLNSSPTFATASSGSTSSTVKPGGSITYSASYTIEASAYNSGSIKNTATVTGSSPGNSNDVSDVSDDGDDTDGNTTNDQTIIYTVALPSIKATKTATVLDSNLNGINDSGDIITYSILLHNTGAVTLTSVTISDTLTDGNSSTLTLTSGPTFSSSSSGSTQGTLKAGESATYTATYTISLIAAETGSINNTVTVIASSPGNTNDVSDVSDDGDDNDGNTINDPTVIQMVATKILEVTKTASVTDLNNNSLNDIGDAILYSITVQNKGNVTLTSVTISDTLTDGNSSTLVLTSGPTFSSASSSSSEGTLLPEEIATYTASFTITQNAVNTGKVINTVLATASSPGNTNDVSDISDDGDDTDGNTIDDPTVIQMAVIKLLEVTKTASVTDVNNNAISDAGDIIVYTILLENKGNSTLTSITISDTLTNGNGTTLSLNSSPTFSSSSSNSLEGTLLPGETASYTVSYTITQTDVSSGRVENTVTGIGSSPGNTNDVTDVSDDGDDTDGNTTNDPTIIQLLVTKQLEVTKTASVTDVNNNAISDVGDSILYTITVENKGNVTLTGITLTDTLKDGNSNVLSLVSGPTFTSSTSASSQGTLISGEIATYTASYSISSATFTSGKVENTVTAIGSSPGNTNDVSDISDDGDDTDGNTTNDPTIIQLLVTKKLEATKTASVTDINNNNIVDTGDIISYVIKIENKGNVNITGITIVDTLTDGSSNTLSLTGGPTFVSSTASSTQGTLIFNEIATYTASYTISAVAASSGSIINTVTVSGSSPGNTNDVTDVSDDGDDTDGNTINDPTIVNASSDDIGLEVTKTSKITDNGDGEVEAGDIITYNIEVKNIGKTTLTSVTINDILKDGDGNTLNLSDGPFYTGSDKGSREGVLLTGETAKYIAFYIIEQRASETGKIVNSVIAIGSSPGKTANVSDTSDDGDDTDGNIVDDPTEVFIAPKPSIEVTKIVEITDNGDGVLETGDILTYTITVENTGNISLRNLKITDTIKDGLGNPLTLSNGPYFSGSDMGSNEGFLQVGETANYIAFYIIEQNAANTLSIENSATAIASSSLNVNSVIDVSDNGDDTDGNTVDDPTIVFITPTPLIEVTKVGEVYDSNQDGETGPGDIINYTITVENIGNVNLIDLTLVDTMIDGNGKTLNLTTGPTFMNSSLGSSQGNLKVEEIVAYSASYRIKSADVEAGTIDNSVLGKSISQFDNSLVEDISDNGDDTDNNTVDDPTRTFITFTPEYLEIFNLVTPNGDGLNDFFEIRGVENFPNTFVRIYNRWGVLVFETENYENNVDSDRVFKGFSRGRITIQRNIRLPIGTYYYIINFRGENPGKSSYSGYLYLNN
jgi:gliding motility-associated-like protein/uncharacterized repeat protein (TIGR01451 family)